MNVTERKEKVGTTIFSSNGFGNFVFCSTKKSIIQLWPKKFDRRLEIVEKKSVGTVVPRISSLLPSSLFLHSCPFAALTAPAACANIPNGSANSGSTCPSSPTSNREKMVWFSSFLIWSPAWR